MQKIPYLNIFAGLILVLLLPAFSACNKDDVDPGFDFIEFAIDEDDNVYRIEIDPSGNNVSTATYFSEPELPIYQFDFKFNATDNNINQQARLIIKNSNPFLTGPYPLAGNTPEGMLYFPTFNFLPRIQEQYSLSGVSGGNISITRIGGTDAGSKIEGTFNFSRVQLRDNNNNIISSEHTIKQGRFRITLD